MTIALFGNTLRSDTMREITHIIEFLQLRGIDVALSQELRQDINLRQFPLVDDYTHQTGENIDFALSVGGDGTFLTTAAMVGHLNIPILGINCGHLGFLAEAQIDNVDLILEQLINNQYTIEQRSMLEVTCSVGGYIAAPYALNEIAVLKQGLSSMIAIETYLNGELLHTYKADGLLIVTPTGSTAYNLSVGGPLIDPHTHALLLSPVATHSLNVRPLVIPDDSRIDLNIISRNANYMVSVDGRSQVFSDAVSLHVERSQRTIKLVQLHNCGFMQSLRDKLYWGK